jgi:hypothetical protein
MYLTAVPVPVTTAKRTPAIMVHMKRNVETVLAHDGAITTTKAPWAR